MAFNLDLSDITIPSVCPVLGIPLTLGTMRACDGSPSLDRLDNHEGYVKGNVAVISWRANALKSDATASELAAVVSYIRKHNRRKKRGSGGLQGGH